jgi:hypothetical protein
MRVTEHRPEYQRKSKEQKKKEETRHPFYKSAPLSSNYMLSSIVGFLMSVFLIIPKFSLKWGFTFCVVFGIMFISSIISMTAAPVGDDFLSELHLKELAVHEKVHRKKK